MATERTNLLSSQEKDPCIWMQAGVVRTKYCRIDYNCPACPLDKALQKIAQENREARKAGKKPQGRRGEIVSWKEKLRERPQRRRPCVHYMKGRIVFRACTNDYLCSSCDFDQYFNDQFTVHAVVQPVDVLDVDGIKVPQGYYLHQGHAWAKIEEGDMVRIGIDDFALRVFGPPDQIRTPLIGKQVLRGQPGMTLHRGDHTAKVLLPVTGVVTATNTRLGETGSLANATPYADGWVMQVHAKDLRKDVKHLMIRDETRDFLTEEIDRLYEVIEETAGPLAADGGQLGDDIFGTLPALGWDRLRKLFLRTGK